jgi:hypothetical protein
LPRIHLSSHIFADHASLHTVVLISASYYARATHSSPTVISLLEVSDMAVREIRNALKDETHGTSDPLVAAIAHMASYEALFGSGANCKIHMEGLTAVVSSRGGLSALSDDGLLGKIVLWAVHNASSIM